MTTDPVEEIAAVIEQTLSANALRLTTTHGGYVGGGQPHATLDSDRGAVEAVARGLLARKVAEPSRLLNHPPLEAHVPTPDELDTLLSDISACGYASEAREVVETWTRKWWGVESAFTTKWDRS